MFRNFMINKILNHFSILTPLIKCDIILIECGRYLINFNIEWNQEYGGAILQGQPRQKLKT